MKGPGPWQAGPGLPPRRRAVALVARADASACSGGERGGNPLPATPVATTAATASAIDTSVRPLPPGQPLVVISIGTGLGGFELALTRLDGACVRRIHTCDVDPTLQSVHRALLRYLHAHHPQLDVAGSEASPLPADVCAIDATHLRALRIPDDAIVVITAGWECAPRSTAGLGGGPHDPRSRMFTGLVRLIELCQQLFPARVRWMLENVPVDPSTSRGALSADEQCVRQHLGPPTAVFDAVATGSRATRVRAYWTNCFTSSAFAAALHQMPAPDLSRPLQAFLDSPSRFVSRSVRIALGGKSTPWNEPGEPVRVFPTFTAHRGSYAFQRFKPGCVWERNLMGALVASEPSATERARCMGFPDQFLTSVGVSDATAFRLLGQTIDQHAAAALWGFAFGYATHGPSPHAASTGGLDPACAVLEHCLLPVITAVAASPPPSPPLVTAAAVSTAPSGGEGGDGVGEQFTPDALYWRAACERRIWLPSPGDEVWTVDAAALRDNRDAGCSALAHVMHGAAGLDAMRFLGYTGILPVTGGGSQDSSGVAIVGAIQGLNVTAEQAAQSAAAAVRREEQEGAEMEQVLESAAEDIPLPPVTKLTTDERWAILQKSLSKLSPSLSAEQKVEAEQCVRRWMDKGLFAFDLSELGECTVGGGMTIPLKPGATPVFQKARRVPDEHLETCKKELQQLLDCGILQPSQSAWCANLLLVRKKDGTMRMCVDYRPVNRVTEDWRYPMADIQQILDDVGGRKCDMFSTCDAYKGYWQIPIDPADRAKTAFASPLGHLEFSRVPFGLKTAPATWYSKYEGVCMHLPDTKTFMDDSCTATRGFTAHLSALEQFFTAVFGAGLRLNPKKCSFFSDTAEFVGHHISAEGYRPLDNYVEAVRDAPRPQNVSGLRQFLGLAGYLRRFVPHFSAVVQPLTFLLKKGAAWKWGETEENAMTEVKRLLTTAPVLRFVDPSRPLRVATDWSVTGIGAVLSQFDDSGREYVCGYLSKTCTPAESRYSAFKGELLAVLWACEKWKHYLGGRQFELMTDHKALEWLLTAKELPPSLARWVLRLDEFDIKVCHRPGVENPGPDYLSRNPVHGDSTSRAHTAAVQQSTPATVYPAAPSPPDTAAGAAVLAYVGITGHLPVTASVDAVFTTAILGECFAVLTQLGTGSAALKQQSAEQAESVEQEWLEEDFFHQPPPEALARAALLSAALILVDSSPPVTCQQDGATAASAVPTVFAVERTDDAAAEARLDPMSDELMLRYLREGRDASVLTECSSTEKERVMRRSQRYVWEASRPEQPAGRLLRVFPGGATRIVPSEAERRLLVQEVHATPGGMAHMGVQRTYAGLIHTYWWPGMFQLVSQVVKECPACDRQKASAEVRYPVLQPLPIRGLFHRVSFDLFGPLPLSKRGNCYGMVCVEHLSRMIEVMALRSKDSAETKWAAQQLFSRFGAPAEVVTDCGTEWQGNFHQLLQDFCIDHRTTAGYHAQANGLAERVVQTVKALLTRALADPANEGSDWEELLPGIVLAYNCSPQTSTKQAPYALLYGRVPLLPVQAAARMQTEVDPDDPEVASLDLADRVALLRKAVPMAMGNLEIAQHRDTLRYARVHGGGYAPVITRIHPGDVVYVRDHAATALEPGVKRTILQVVEVREGGTVVLIGRDARTISLSVHDVVPCHLPNVDLTLDPSLRDATYDVPCEHCLEVQCTATGPRAMLLCDACSTGWHLGCLRHVQPTAPRKVPRAAVRWYCHRCRAIGRVPEPVHPTGESKSP